MTAAAGVGPDDGEALRELVEDILDLERIEENIYRGRSPKESFQRVFGGQVAGQAMVAAGRTVPTDRAVHSLHGYFIRPGDPDVPIVYEVDRTRDGRSFITRRVVAVQHGRTIFSMSASFQLAEQGLEHATAMPAVPPPDGLPSIRDLTARFGERRPPHLKRGWPLDIRYVDGSPWEPRVGREPRNRVWVRAVGPLPDDPLLHGCVLTYASDLTLLDSVIMPHGLVWHGLVPGREFSAASLDHAVWFHRPFRADDWLLYDQESPSASGGRGLATGRFFAADGRLVASVVQEGLIRTIARRAGADRQEGSSG